MESFVAGNLKVLVVDDNLINREVLKALIETYGFDISEAASGFEAIELVKKTKFDLIIMDHMMPEMDGIQAVQVIRGKCGENGRSPVILALTANDIDQGVREQFLNNGFQDVLAKPLERLHVNEVLSRWFPGSVGEKAQENDDGDRTELLRLYCMDGKRKMVLLKKLFEEKDYNTYEVEVHGLKSASANIGDMEISAAFKDHEDAAARGDTQFIAENFHKLAAAYEEQLEQIRKLLDEKQDGKESAKGNLPPIEQKVMAAQVREALKQLERFRSRESLGTVENLLQHELPDKVAAGLTEVKEQLKLYEDELAEQLLHGLLEWIDEEEV